MGDVNDLVFFFPSSCFMVMKVEQSTFLQAVRSRSSPIAQVRLDVPTFLIACSVAYLVMFLQMVI